MKHQDLVVVGTVLLHLLLVLINLLFVLGFVLIDLYFTNTAFKQTREKMCWRPGWHVETWLLSTNKGKEKEQQLS